MGSLTFKETTGKNVLLLPMGSSDDGAHSQNEKINVINYIEGVSITLNNDCKVELTVTRNVIRLNGTERA